MKHRSMRRDDWKNITDKTFIVEDFTYKHRTGKISILKMNKVSEKIEVDDTIKRTVISDNGYSWVQIAFEGECFWMTAMFDDKGRFIEIYTDMTNGNVTETDNPYFEDMYLDYVIFENDIVELDKEELEEAYKNCAISEEQYVRTLTEGRKLVEYVKMHQEELIADICGEYERLAGKL